jgi:glycosyltransferase domain-containing protein
MDFTIVCLTYNRHYVLTRLIEYYKNFSFHLIIADGSDRPFEINTLLENCKLVCTYLHIPSVSGVPRLKASCELISTKYCCLIDDSDILLGTGIYKCMEFLDMNHDYSCVSGDVVYSYRDKVFDQSNFIPWGHWSSSFELTGEKEDRLSLLINEIRTANLVYSVTRSEYLKKHPDLVEDLGYSFSGAYELIWAALLTLSGKYAKLNFPFWIRTGGDSHPEPIPDSVVYVNYQIPESDILIHCKTLGRLTDLKDTVFIKDYYTVQSRRLRLKYEKELKFGWIQKRLNPLVLMVRNSYLGSILRLIKRRSLSKLNKNNYRWDNSLTFYYKNNDISEVQRKDLEEANILLNSHKSC